MNQQTSILTEKARRIIARLINTNMKDTKYSIVCVISNKPEESWLTLIKTDNV